MVFSFGAGCKPVSGCVLHKPIYLFRWPRSENPKARITFWLSRKPWASSLFGDGVWVMAAFSTGWPFPCVVCCYHQELMYWAQVTEAWSFDPVSRPWVCPLGYRLSVCKVVSVFLIPCSPQPLLTEKATQIWHIDVLRLEGHAVLGVACLWVTAEVWRATERPAL